MLKRLSLPREVYDRAMTCPEEMLSGKITDREHELAVRYVGEKR